MGLHAMRLDDGSVVASQNADIRMIPASNQKLLSCLYALAVLGPEHRIQTRIWKEGNAIIVDAPGDFSLTRAALAEARNRLGLSGEVPVHVRQAYRQGVPPTWEIGYLYEAYAPRVSAFTVDSGRIELWASRGKLEPLPAALGVNVQVRGGTGEPRASMVPLSTVIEVRGKLPEARTLIETFAIPDPDRAAARFLGGPLREERPLPDRPADLVLTSPPMIDLVTACLQPSNNHHAEHLMLLAALAQGAIRGDLYAEATRRMDEALSDLASLEAWEIDAADGSGMSRKNLVTPRAITQLLRWPQSQPWGPQFKTALARPGVGTLRSRLAGVQFQGKTGTLSYVTCLSGYLTTNAGQTLVVSILMNHASGSSTDLRAVQDELVRLLQQGEPIGTSPAGEE